MESYCWTGPLFIWPEQAHDHLSRCRHFGPLRMDIAKKFVGRLGFTVRITTDEMIGACAAAVHSNKVETRDRLRVAITNHAEDAITFAGTIAGDEIIHVPGLAVVERNGSALLGTLVEISQS
jgi:hypothetical protein